MQTAMSTATTAKIQTCTAVEGMRRDVQARFEQNRADALRRERKNHGGRWIKLQSSYRSLQSNSINSVLKVKRMWVKRVSRYLWSLSSVFELQSSRIDVVNESVKKSQKDC